MLSDTQHFGWAWIFTHWLQHFSVAQGYVIYDLPSAGNAEISVTAITCSPFSHSKYNMLLSKKLQFRTPQITQSRVSRYTVSPTQRHLPSSFQFVNNSLQNICKTPTLPNIGPTMIESLQAPISAGTLLRSPRLEIQCTSIIGKRKANEDAHVFFTYQNYTVIGLYDGHNGSSVAQYCAMNLEHTFIRECMLSADSASSMKVILDNVTKSLHNAVKSHEKMYYAGTTAVIAVIDKSQNCVHVSNIGDSRLIVGYQNGNILQTKDHKPQDVEETLRIRNAGGDVVNVNGIYRINRIISVSRSIGDSYIDNLVICEQDYYKFDLNDASYILLGCDGLFDVFSSNEVDQMISQASNGTYTNLSLQKVMNSSDLDQSNYRVLVTSRGSKNVQLYENVDQSQCLCKQITQALTKLAYMKGSEDNVSAILCMFN